MVGHAGMRDVWMSNFEAELQELWRIAGTFNHVAIDMEYPGIVLEVDDDTTLGQSGVTGVSSSRRSRNYLQVRQNVNQLRCIQLGLSFSDEKGRKPDRPTFQFNFKFDLAQEWHATDAIALLENAGLDLRRHAVEGIPGELFGQRLMGSGLVLNAEMRWVSFHGMYDFGYLLKLLTAAPLPKDLGVLRFPSGIRVHGVDPESGGWAIHRLIRSVGSLPVV